MCNFVAHPATLKGGGRRGNWAAATSLPQPFNCPYISSLHLKISETIIGQDSLSILPIWNLLAESCVFVKQSCSPILCSRNRVSCYSSILGHLIANLRWHFVEFLNNPSLIALVFSTFSLVSDLVQSYIHVLSCFLSLFVNNL